MAVAISCPACRAPLKLETAPAPGAAVRCPRCRAVVPLAVDDRTQPPPSTRPGEPDAVQTVVRKAPLALGVPTADTPLLDPPQRPDEIGRLGRYRVLGEIGRGGMGVVYRAEEPQLRRSVALKVMLPQFASNPASKARFLREAHAQAAVEHAHVVIIYEAGDVGGVAYLAMPLLKGQTLGAALKQNPRPPLKEVVRIGKQVAEGLSAAHDVGLMHRDIKPGNVWLDGPRRQVKILDFGLARAADAAEATARDPLDARDPLGARAGSVTTDEARTDVQTDAPLTIQGAVVGTPLYMSPEQGRGEKVDFRTDLYSLGVMLYQMTTGRLPFVGSTPVSILIAIETESPPPPRSVPGVPGPLSDLIMRLLSKRPADRPSSAEAVAAELQRMEVALESASRVVATPVAVANDPWSDLETDDPTSIEAAPVVRAKRPAEAPRPRWPLFAAVGCGVLLVATILLALKPARTAPTDPEPEPIAQKPWTPPRPVVPKENDQEKEKQKDREKDVVKFARALWPQLTDLTPTLRIDYSNGPPRKGPVAKRDPDGKYEWKAGANALRFTTTGGTWWALAGPLPNTAAAIELKARVVSPVGAVLLNPWSYPAPSGDGTAGALLTIDHLGTLKLQAHRDKTPAEFPSRTFNHAAIKPRGEWNTILTILRDDRMDVYVNGEEVVTGVALWPVPAKQVRFGVRWSGAPAEVEHERITIWDLSTLPKK